MNTPASSRGKFTDDHDVLSAARAIAPLLADRATEGERRATTPPDVLDAIADAGLFTLLLPAALGGTPCDPSTVVDVIETVAHADGSAGWTTMIGNGSSLLAWYEPEVGRRVLATSRYPTITSVFAPRGRAIPAGSDRYRISGRWVFNSGAPHCDWFLAAVVIDDDDTSPPPDADLSNVRFALFPARDAEIVETWQAAGLQGTGSHDITVSDAVVPGSYLTNPFYDPVHYNDVHCRLPFWTLMMILMSGFPLGVARRALDEFGDYAPRRARSHAGSLALDPVVQVDLARADAALAAARSAVHQAVSHAWHQVRHGLSLSIPERARVTAANLHAMTTGVQVVDQVFSHAGGSALYLTNPLQRCLRDIHAANQHIAYSTEAWRSVGRALLDVPQPDLRI
jgi:alkylation response protein AidB-like acyl-CoA dehydrogenase